MVLFKKVYIKNTNSFLKHICDLNYNMVLGDLFFSKSLSLLNLVLEILDEQIRGLYIFTLLTGLLNAPQPLPILAFVDFLENIKLGFKFIVIR